MSSTDGPRPSAGRTPAAPGGPGGTATRERPRTQRGSGGALTQADRSGVMGDRIFSSLALIAGVVILVTLGFVALFLTYNSAGAVYQEGEGWIVSSFVSYAYPLVVGTLIAAGIALVLATPVAIGVALYISHFAPARLSRPIGYVIDLLAAIPSVVYGAWGMSFLGPALVPAYDWLHETLGFIPLFADAPSQTGRTILTAGIVLGVMILPIITSVCREIFIQTPKLHEEAALALGATRWEMIKMSVFPFARPGIISGVMLGLGRALGETMAVALVLSPGLLTASLISSGNSTIPAEIALGFPEAPPGSERQAQLIAIGLVLFIITLIVNMTARWIVSRNKEFSGAN